MVDAVRATADALNTSLEQMQVVEDMRRTLREIRDKNKLDSISGVARVIIRPVAAVVPAEGVILERVLDATTRSGTAA